MDYGKLLQFIRKKAGYTQKELGEKLGVSASMIAQYENNLRRPKLETLAKLADALNTNVPCLLGLAPFDSNDRESLELFQNNFESSISDFKAHYGELNPITCASPVDLGRLNLLDAYNSLNEDGQKKAQERVQELTEIPKYLKKKSPEE